MFDYYSGQEISDKVKATWVNCIERRRKIIYAQSDFAHI